MQVRELTDADRPAVLELNERSVLELSPLDDERLRYILALAYRSVVVERDDDVLAFAIAIAPETEYDSRNYARLSERFQRFLYLDRIAVATGARRRGLGAMLYDALEQAAQPFGRMVCDVNVEPPNEASLAFHAARGYQPLEQLTHAEKRVVLLSKELGQG
jgi:uncharacterized protein